MSKKLGLLAKLVSPIVLLASVFAGSVAPAHAAGSQTIIRLDGISGANATDNSATAAVFVGNGWYNPGLRYFETHQVAGTTQHLSYTVTDETGAAIAGKAIHLLMGKGYSGSTAIISSGGQTTNGSDDYSGNSQAVVDGVTDASGHVSFDVANNNTPSQGANYNSDPTAVYTGNHLFSQIAAVSGGANDVIDIIDMVFTKEAGVAAPVDALPVLRLAGIDTTNAFERTGDEGTFVGQYGYHAGTRVFTKQLPIGSTTTLTYAVSNANDGKNIAGATVKLHVNKAWAGANANVTVNGTNVNGTPYVDCGGWYGQCADGAVITGTTNSQGLVSFTLKNNDIAADAANYPTAANAEYTGKHLFSQITANIGTDASDIEDVVDFVFYKPAVIDPAAGLTSTFESDDTTGAALGGAADFGGNVSSVINSPVAGNTGMVGKITNGAASWSGSTFLILPRGSQLISSTSKIVTVDFYSTTPLDSVLLKLEGGTNEPASQVSASHGGTGWETLTFDFTGAFDPAGNYFKASIFADFSGASHPGGVYYFDNVHFVGGSKAAVVIPMTHTSTLVNFEAGDNSGYAIGATNDFGGTVSTLVTNAPMFGSTGSTKAAKIIPGNNCWAGTTLISMPWGQSGISTDGKIVTANVWAPAAGLSVKLKMEDSKDSNATIETDATTTKVGWQKLTWDFGTPTTGTAAFTSARIYNKVSVFPAFDCGSADAKVAADHNGAAWYLDDLAMNGATSAVIASMPAPVVSVLGATSVKSGAVVNLVGTGLYNLPGTSVALFTAATKTAAAITTPLTIVGGSADGTKLIVRGPAVTQKGVIKVTTNGGTVSSTATLSASSVATAKPALTMAANLVQAVGDVVTLNGANIGSATAVTIGSTTAAFTVVDSNSITVTVPAGVVSGSAISLTNAAGTTTSTKFVYLAPTVASVTASAKVGDTITISGTNLAKLTSIVFGGNKAAKAVTNTATSVTVVVPTGALTGTIKLVNGGGTVNTSSFTVVPPAPTIKSFTPVTGTKGTTVVSVSGTNLLNASVTVNGVAVTISAGATATALKFTIPAGATTGKIAVTTAGGTATSTANLTVN
jgi:hypothetical protein